MGDWLVGISVTPQRGLLKKDFAGSGMKHYLSADYYTVK